MILGNATVYVPPEQLPDHGGGPIRRSPLLVTRSGDGMPPYGTPQMVLRTPHAVVPDAEPLATYPGVTRMKFLPDGRLVPGDALGAPLGLSADKMTSTQAGDMLFKQYVQLHTAAWNMANTYKKLGIAVPCALREKHNAAVAFYLATWTPIIQQIVAGGGTVNQFLVDQQGNIQRNADGSPKLRQLSLPLRPATFTVSDCQKSGALGFIPFVVIGTAVVAGILVGGTIVYIKTRGPNEAELHIQEYQKGLDSALQCLRDADAAGYKGQAAVNRCAGVQAAVPKTPSPGGIGVLGWIGVATLVAAGVGGVTWYLRKRRSP